MTTAHLSFLVPLTFLLTHPVWDVTIKATAVLKDIEFLLTHPVWDVTFFCCACWHWEKISTHTSRVGCDAKVSWCSPTFRISTHTSRVGCDGKFVYVVHIPEHFYSHIPCGMWRKELCRRSKGNHFYSHIPCGMWPLSLTVIVTSAGFLLTHPVWDVTELDEISNKGDIFLLTHPVWDVTDLWNVGEIHYLNFYSHIPCGMWRVSGDAKVFGNAISTHTSRVGCDRYI